MEEINHFDGLSEVEAENLLKQYGSNEFVKLYKFSALSSFLSGFKSPLIIILLSAAAVAGILDDWLSSVIIFVMVSLGIVLDFVNSYKSEKTAQALKEKVKITATVIRDRKKQEIKLSDIVPGDIVLLSPGDLVPADGEVLEARDFFINESSLTGESFPVEKNIGGQVLMGSSVTIGNAVMRVVMTGIRTRFGKIAESISKKEEPTEFDRGIKDFSFLILYLTITLVILWQYQ